MERERLRRSDDRARGTQVHVELAAPSTARAATPGKGSLVEALREHAHDFEAEVHFRVAQARKHLSELATANAAADARRSGVAAREIELHLEYARTASDASLSPELRAIVEELAREAQSLLATAFKPSREAMQMANRWVSDCSALERETASWV